MDGHGGSRKGSGRKSRAEEMGLPLLVEQVIGDQGKRDLLTKIHEQAKAGSFNHQQLLMQYIYGKPQDKLDVTTGGEKIETKEIIFRNYADQS